MIQDLLAEAAFTFVRCRCKKVSVFAVQLVGFAGEAGDPGRAARAFRNCRSREIGGIVNFILVDSIQHVADRMLLSVSRWGYDPIGARHLRNRRSLRRARRSMMIQCVSAGLSFVVENQVLTRTGGQQRGDYRRDSINLVPKLASNVRLTNATFTGRCSPEYGVGTDLLGENGAIGGRKE